MSVCFIIIIAIIIVSSFFCTVELKIAMMWYHDIDNNVDASGFDIYFM